MKQSNYCVYTLLDPRDNQVHYVGMTRNTWQRLQSHMSDPECSKQKRIWLQELKQNELKPTMDIVENELSREQAFERERYWIRFHLSQGCALYNHDTPKIRPEEVANLLREHHGLLNRFAPQDEQWLEEKSALQDRTQALLTELEANYKIRPFVRYQNTNKSA